LKKINRENATRVLATMLAITALMAMTGSALGVEHSAGVTAGMFAEYQITYQTDIHDDEPVIDSRPAWFKLEVQRISGNRVTVRLFAQGNDGSTPQGSGDNYVCSIEDGTINSMYSTSGPMDAYPRFLLTGANIVYDSKGTELFEQDCFSHFAFDRNEARTYLGTNRNVNVFSETTTSSSSISNDTGTWEQTTTITETIVFDKVTGLLLGANYDSRQTRPDSLLNLRIITELVDTSVFEHATTTTPAPSPSIPEMSCFTMPLLTAAITVGAIVCRKISRGKQSSHL
jgi:hypothetical protein